MTFVRKILIDFLIMNYCGLKFKGILNRFAEIIWSVKLYCGPIVSIYTYTYYNSVLKYLHIAHYN